MALGTMWKFQVIYEVLKSVSKSLLQGIVAYAYNKLSLQETEAEGLT